MRNNSLKLKLCIFIKTENPNWVPATVFANGFCVKNFYIG